MCPLTGKITPSLNFAIKNMSIVITVGNVIKINYDNNTLHITSRIKCMYLFRKSLPIVFRD